MNISILFSRFFFLIFLLSFISLCKGQSNSVPQSTDSVKFVSSKLAKINELLSTYAEYGEFNGAALVSEKGNVIFKQGFGLASLAWEIPNERDTKFRLASITKQFTAMLILKLVSENKLALDVPITTYLPDYPKTIGDKINIHHLLTHTSGLPNYTSFSNYGEMMRDPITPMDILKIFQDSSLLFNPGERFRYSNSGYAILGVIIEQISGKSYEDVLREKILVPLGMNNTGLDNSRTVLKRKARGYDKNGGSFMNASYIDMSIAYSAGGMYSTVEDLYLWDQALYGEKLLPKKFVDMIFEKHIPAWDGYYGYGWALSEKRLGNSSETLPAIHHDGIINGFSSLLLRIPSDQSAIILLNNTGGAPLYDMASAILGILYDKPYEMPKKSIGNLMLEVVEKEGIANGLSFYEKVKNDPSYSLVEEEMNVTAYHLLQSNQVAEAEAIFKLITLQFFQTPPMPMIAMGKYKWY